METNDTPVLAPTGDEAREALNDITGTQARVRRSIGYPLWFWVLSGLALAALPAGNLLHGRWRDATALAATALLIGVLFAAQRIRGVREQCATLGLRGWIHELGQFAPALAVLMGAVVLSNNTDSWVLPVAGAVATAVAWVATGVLTHRVAPAQP